MTDRIELHGLRARGHHGVFDHERRDGQRFVIDLTLGLDTRLAAETDDLKNTVDYGTLVAQVKAAVETDPVDLVETLADRVARVCLSGSRVEWVQVTVHKPEAPIEAPFSDVALSIRRDAKEHP